MDIKTKAIVCDLDGTLCNCEHRRHFLHPVVTETNRDFPIETAPKPKPKKDWKNFNANIPYDTLNEWCYELIFAMFHRGYHIIFVSGRSEDNREITLEWLFEKFNDANLRMLRPSLFMRKEKDNRKDSIVKKEIYETYIKDKYDVLFCIDDRDQVVEEWRRLGLVCLQCAPGNF